MSRSPVRDLLGTLMALRPNLLAALMSRSPVRDLLGTLMALRPNLLAALMSRSPVSDLLGTLMALRPNLLESLMIYGQIISRSAYNVEFESSSSNYCMRYRR